MKPEIKSLFSTGLNRGELPDNPSDCAVLIEANIGAEAEEGSEIFSFQVVTASFLEKASKPRWGRGYLIVDFFLGKWLRFQSINCSVIVMEITGMKYQLN